jgi:hypothetical protein
MPFELDSLARRYVPECPEQAHPGRDPPRAKSRTLGLTTIMLSRAPPRSWCGTQSEGLSPMDARAPRFIRRPT